MERAILSHETIEDVAVLGVPDKYMGERVKAVLVPAATCDLSETELAALLEEHCRERLAPYKVPRIFEVRKQLPRNSTGKVLKKIIGRSKGLNQNKSARFF